jgi:hypothetical protein
VLTLGNEGDIIRTIKRYFDNRDRQKEAFLSWVLSSIFRDRRLAFILTGSFLRRRTPRIPTSPGRTR